MRMRRYWAKLLEHIGVAKCCSIGFLIICCHILYYLQPVLISAIIAEGQPELTVIYLILLGAAQFATTAIDMLNNSLQQATRKYSKLIIIDELSKKDYAYYCRMEAASIQSYVNEISLASRQIEHSFATTVLRLIAMLGVYSVLFLQYGPIATIAYLLLVLCYAALSVRFARSNQTNISESLRATSAVNAQLQDYAKNISAVMSCKAQGHELEITRSLLENEKDVYSKTQGRTNRNSLILQVLFIVFAALVLVVISVVHENQMYSTALLSLLFTALSMNSVGEEFLVIGEMLQRIAKGMEHLELDSKDNVASIVQSGMQRKADAPALQVHELSFAYEGKEPLFSDLTLQFKSGKMTALVGPNGCGKSTLLKIMAGIIPLQEGTVTLPCEKDAEVLYISQDCELFNRTIADNIAYPQKEFDANFVQKIVEQIGLDTVIKSNDDLLNKRPGDFSRSLSGGEIQKILLLRAIVSNPKVLLCDEITSSLDPQSSEECYRMLAEYLPHATIVCVVHRQDELSKFSEIVRMKERA